jgi:hypothetical protein
MNVRPIEARDINLRRAAEDLAHDVAPRRLIRRRRESPDGNTGEGRPQALQHVVFRPEGRPPLRDAMCLVDGDERHVEPGERRDHPLRHQPLRREVEKPHLARRHLAPDGDILIPVRRGIDGLSRNTRQLQRGHLVLHQRDERRNDDGKPAPRQRRHLVAQRLAGPRRHHRQHVPAFKQSRDDPLLPEAERFIAECLAQDVVRGHGWSSTEIKFLSPSGGEGRVRGSHRESALGSPDAVPPPHPALSPTCVGERNGDGIYPPPSDSGGAVSIT